MRTFYTSWEQIVLYRTKSVQFLGHGLMNSATRLESGFHRAWGFGYRFYSEFRLRSIVAFGCRWGM